MSQDEVYLEAVTEGYLIDGFFPNLRSTALPKTPENPEEFQQSSQSKDSDVFDERLDAVHNVSTSESVELHQSFEQSSTESNDNFEGSGDPIQVFITRLSNHRREHNASATDSTELFQSTRKPTTEFTDFPEGSGDPIYEFPWLHATTQSGSHTQNTQKPNSETTESGTFEGSEDTPTQVFFPNGEHLTTTQSSTTVVMQGDFEGSASGDSGMDKFFLSTSASPVSTTQTGSVSSTYRPPQVIVLGPRRINPSPTSNSGQSLDTHNPQPGKGEYTMMYSHVILWLFFIVYLTCCHFLFLVHEIPHSENDRTPGKSLDQYNIGDILAQSRHCSS